MSDLVAEFALRIAKAGVVALLGAGLYLVATGPLGETASVSLALLCWISAAAFWLLVESSPL